MSENTSLISISFPCVMYGLRLIQNLFSLCLHSTLETTFDTTVTTEVNGRSLPALTTRSSPMAWRLGQSQTPRLQAGDAPSMPSSYAAPRASTTSAGTTTGRYSGHSDPSRFVYTAPLRQAAAGAKGAGQEEKGQKDGSRWRWQGTLVMGTSQGRTTRWMRSQVGGMTNVKHVSFS